MLQPFKTKLILMCFITIMVFPIVILTTSSIIRAIFAFPITFFLPGYSLLLVVYPLHESLNGIEKLLLGFALSQAVVPLILLMLNYIWNLSFYPSLIAVTIFTLLMLAIAWWQQRKLSSENRFTLSVSKGSNFKLAVILKSPRFILWLVLLILSVSILLFPVNITLDTSPVQSVNIFANLPLFIVLFLGWMAALLILLFSKRIGARNDWERLGLICIFSIIFSSYWTILTPYSNGGDSISNLGIVKYLQQVEKIPNPPFKYLDFPGTFLFTNFLSQISNLDIYLSGNLLIISSTTLFCALIYLFFTKLLKNSYAASLALLIAVIWGQLIRAEFRPDTLGYVLLAGFLVLLTKDKRTPLRVSGDILLTIILLGAVTITYLMHSGLFFFILLGIFTVQVLGRREKISILLLFLPLLIIMSWEVYSATREFSGTVAFLPSFVERLKSLDFLFTAEQRQTASLGTVIPSWTVAVRYFRLVGFYVLGTILGLIALARFKKLNSGEQITAGGFLGVGLISILLLVLWPAGHQYNRYLWYTPMFLAPIIVMFIFHQRWQKYMTIVLVITLFATSLPIFLTNGSGISAAYVSPEDCAAGEYLNKQYGGGDDLTVYSNYIYGGDIAWYYMPRANGKGPREFSYLKDADALLDDVQKLMEEFQSTTNNSVFVYSERRALGWYQIFGIKPDDPRWQNIKARLAGENEENILFSNDYIHIYKSPKSLTPALYSGN